MPPGFLFDLDGTLYTDDGPIPGAVELISELRRRGIPFRFVTNTTRRGRDTILGHMRSIGFSVEGEELLTPMVVAEAVLSHRGVKRVAPFISQALLEDLRGVELVGGTCDRVGPDPPDAVLIGDLGDQWSPALLNEAFRYALEGATLVALQKGRYWLGPTGLEMDAGPYVAAVEYAAGKESVVCGKPERPFFEAALGSLGFQLPFADRASAPAMVGDDVWNDVQGAQRAGIQGWLVRTGKFREDALAGSGIEPDRLMQSVVGVMEGELWG